MPPPPYIIDTVRITDQLGNKAAVTGSKLMVGIQLMDSSFDLVSLINGGMPVNLVAGTKTIGKVGINAGENLIGKIEIVDGVKVASVDAASGVLETLTHGHHEIHEGNSYYAERVATVNTDGIVTLLVVTPDTTKWSHLNYILGTTKGASFELFQNSDSVGGTEVVPRNRNRNRGDNSTITITHTPSAQGSGTLLQTRHIGSSGKYAEAGETRGINEWILKRNTTYLLRVTSHEDANEVVLGMNWYEMTDKY